jgi:glucokinase
MQSNANYISIDLSDATIRAAIVDVGGRVIERREVGLENENILSEIEAVVSNLRESYAQVEGICIGLPGIINHQTQRVVVSTALPKLVEEDLHKYLMESTGLRVMLENDANAAAFAEYKIGAGAFSRNMFYATIGAGVGGAIIIDGKLWTGANGFAGEFGHIVIDPEGTELEAMASAANIIRRTRARLERDNTSSLSLLSSNPSFTVTDIVEAARSGDDFAEMMLARTGKFIGMAVTSVINLLNIERIVIGGGVMEAGDLILNPLKEEAERLAFKPCYEATEIVAATLGTDAVAIGATLLAHESEN